MKQIPLLQGKALLIELSKQDFIKAKIQTLVDLHTVWSGKLNFKNGDRWESVSLPPGNWRIIGMLSEVTNEEMADVTGFYYNKYNERYVEMPTSAMRATPIGDVEDAILAEGFTFQNNLRNPDDVCYFSRDRMIDDVRDYHEVQSRVLDRSRCLLLGRGSN